MNKSLSRTLLLAGMVAAAGAAQAQTFDSPTRAGEASTMTHGAPNQATTNSPHGDHSGVTTSTTLGAGASTQPTMVTVQPSAGSDTAITYIDRPVVVDHKAAAATFNVPGRAGEASTMTGGAPNMVTDNERVINQSPARVISK
jgi:hypothetical protein